jgi:glycerol-3-phosphate dehydrogenase (NAD(P)+)
MRHLLLRHVSPRTSVADGVPLIFTHLRLIRSTNPSFKLVCKRKKVEEQRVVNVAIMGAGSWGTTLAKVFADAGNIVTLWARRPELAEQIRTTRTNPDYLPDIRLPESVHATSSAEEALAAATIVVFAVPSQTMRDNLTAWTPLLPSDSTLVSISKGVETGTHLRMSEVIAEITGADPTRIAVLSGPNLAREIAEEQPAATVIACVDENRARLVQAAVATPYLRPYTNTDVVGVELGGACKNVIALACGVATGLGFGENTLATIITRGLAEISRLGAALGADQRTFSGLAGLGDLVATCSSPLSRNRSFGVRLGEGGTLEEAKKATHGQVAEGVISSNSVFQLAEANKVEMPITQAVYAVCHRGLDVRDMIAALMGRSRKAE